MEREMLLEKYLLDELTETEWQEFKEILKKDPDFGKEVDFQIDVKRAVTADEDDNFRNLISDFESEAKTTASQTTLVERSKVKALPTKWLVAASAILLVGLGYFFTTNQNKSNKDLFAQNFKPYRNVIHPTTRGDEAMDTKDKAFGAYSKGDYQDAIPLFAELYTTEKQPYYLFYEANALIQLNRAAEAIPLLLEHLKTEDSLIDKSNWYLAMAYLQLEDSENAKRVLKRVVETNAYKAEEAKQLLDAL